MPFDPRRAHAAATRSAEHLNRRTLPSPYPEGDPVELWQARLGSGLGRGRDATAVLVNMRDGGLELLRQALKLEAQAKAASEAAIEGLRMLGQIGPSWAAIGAELELSAQAAHKRYRHLEERRELTIDDELERPAA